MRRRELIDKERSVIQSLLLAKVHRVPRLDYRRVI